MTMDDKNNVAPENPEEGTEETTVDGAVDNGSAPEDNQDQIDVDAIAEEADAAVAEVVEETDADRVAKAEAEAAAVRDKYLRLQAEWDNFRKRSAEEAADQRVRAAEKLMNDVMPVLDDFERAIAHAEQNGEAGLLDGVKAIGSKLNQVLAKHGLEAIDPAGQAFDALEHQAVATVPDETVPDETVAQVYQKGYRLGKRVLRPAMVTISCGGPKREAPAEEN